MTLESIDFGLILGIVGSRVRDTQKDYDKIFNAYLDVFCRLENEARPITIVSGGAYRGGDKFAVEIARRNGHKMLTFFPDLSDIPAGIEGQGMADSAYMARNEVVARCSDILIAAPRDGHCGTRHTMFRFKILHPKGELIAV